MKKREEITKKFLLMLLSAAVITAAAAPARADYSQLAKLTASDATGDDFFGLSVAISGTTALVGAEGNDDAGTDSGSAYLYDFSDPCSIIETKLTASDAAAYDLFGRSVAISGTTALVGAWLDDDAGSSSGSAYLYDFSDPCNITEIKLTASDAAAGDEFGFSVALSGSTALVGARRNDDAGTDSVGVSINENELRMWGYAKLNTILFDDFEDDNYTANPPWTPVDTGTGIWAVITEDVIRQNKVLEASTADGPMDRLYVTFPAYTYNASDSNTFDPDGPEWRVSLRYSIGYEDDAQNNNNHLQVWMGDSTADYNQCGLYSYSDGSSDDDPNFKMVLYQSGTAGTAGAGGDDYYAIRWFWLTLEWEGSTNTLTATHYNPLTGFSQSFNWTPLTQYNTYDKLTIHGGFDDVADTWMFDDVKVEVARIPFSCAETLAYGLGLDEDLNQDCSVDFEDFVILAANWLGCNDANNPACAATASVITADAGTQLGSDGDLDKIRRGFHGAGSDTVLLASQWDDYYEAIGLDSLRMGHVYGTYDDINDIWTAGMHMWIGMNNANTYGLSLNIVIDAYPNRALPVEYMYQPTPSDPNTYYGVEDVNGYKKWAKALVRTVTDGIDSHEVELSIVNEPDGVANTWLLPLGQRNGPMGSATMYNAYIDFYELWSDIVTEFEADANNAGKTVYIGGPVIMGPFTWTYGEFNWAYKFCEDVNDRGLQLDMFIWHFYGLHGAIAGRTNFGPYPSFRTLQQDIRDALDRNGLASVPIHLTEWGPSYRISDNEPAGIINASHAGAAWTAAFLPDMFDSYVDKAHLLMRKNNFHSIDNYWSDSNPQNWGWAGFLDVWGEQPTALYNVCLMYSMLPGERISVSESIGNVDVVASADATSAGVLAYNYNYDFIDKIDNTQTEPVRVTVNNLAFNNQYVRVKQYLVDETHSNAWNKVENNQPPDYHEAQLQKVDDYTIWVDSNGEVELHYTELSPSAVSLWLIDVPAPYVDGFTWNRSTDWTTSDNVLDTTTGNPDPDSEGADVWYYEQSTSGGNLASGTPWYDGTMLTISWRSGHWWSDMGTQDGKILQDTLRDSLYYVGAAPVARWLNPVGDGTVVDIDADMSLSWEQFGIGDPANRKVDIAIVHKDVSAGTSTVLFSGTYTAATVASIPVNIDNVFVDEGDSILLTIRGDALGLSLWGANLNDSSYTITLLEKQSQALSGCDEPGAPDLRGDLDDDCNVDLDDLAVFVTNWLAGVSN